MHSDHEKILINPSYAYLSGGHGYILSRQASKIVAAMKSPVKEGEDFMVGYVLGPFFASGELTARAFTNYENVVAFHLGCGYYGSGNRIEGHRTDPASAVRRKHAELGRS
jgi:hypothetical protein